MSEGNGKLFVLCCSFDIISTKEKFLKTKLRNKIIKLLLKSPQMVTTLGMEGGTGASRTLIMFYFLI